jgi:hypothetical protein
LDGDELKKRSTITSNKTMSGLEQYRCSLVCDMTLFYSMLKPANENQATAEDRNARKMTQKKLVFVDVYTILLRETSAGFLFLTILHKNSTRDQFI